MAGANNTDEKKVQEETVDAAKNVAAITTKPEETQEKEPMIPLSEVEKLIEKKMAEREAQAPQSIQKTPVYDKKMTNLDDIPELRDFELKDRIYVLVDGTKPPSYGIRLRHKTLSPLQYYNSETNINHSLRYATNQNSFFMDKQEGEAMTTHLSIKNGIMRLPKEEANLQKFLHIHPDKNNLWKELDVTVENNKMIAEEDLLFEAQKLAREVKYTTLEAVARIICPAYDDTWTVSEVKAQVYQELKKDPARFTRIANDESIEIKGNVKTALKRGIISYKNFKYISDKGDVLLEVPRHEDELDAFVAWTETNKGGIFYQYIKGQL